MFKFILLLLCILPLSSFAQDETEGAPDTPTPSAPDTAQFGMGVICPRPGTQVIFYTQSNQQDAAGSVDYKGNPPNFVVTSATVRDLNSAGAGVLDGYCNFRGTRLPGIRIDVTRDGWLLAGRMWLPPNQEWEYTGWAELLRKSTIWKPLVPVGLYGGTMEEVAPDKPYLSSDALTESLEIYPIRLLDNYALVLLDETGSFAKNCAGQSVAPAGKLGWMRLYRDDGKPVAVPAHPKGCEKLYLQAQPGQ